jgi:uracil-DNA glycosylase
LDKKTKADVMWVGLSAVKVDCVIKDTPLANTTNTGKLISDIESRNPGIDFYKTNLVKCLPVKDNKIRYPKNGEMKSCFNHLEQEIIEFRPQIVFLLGKQVSDFVTDNKNIGLSNSFDYQAFKKGNTRYVPVHHPSYILVYKRKEMNFYIEGITKIINEVILGIDIFNPKKLMKSKTQIYPETFQNFKKLSMVSAQSRTFSQVP